MIGFAGEGGGSGHRNFLPGVLAGDGATPAGSGLGKELAVNEWAGVFLASPVTGLGATGACLEWWTAAVEVKESWKWLLDSETAALLLQQCPIADLNGSDLDVGQSRIIGRRRLSEARREERERERE